MSQGNVKVGMVRNVAPEDVEIGVRFFSWVPAKGHLSGAATSNDQDSELPPMR